MTDESWLHIMDDFFCAECAALRADAYVWIEGEKLPRCTVCGHRLVFQNTIPLGTRYMAPWKWPHELILRYLARKERDNG